MIQFPFLAMAADGPPRDLPEKRISICELLLRIGARPPAPLVESWYPGLSEKRIRVIYDLVPNRYRELFPTPLNVADANAAIQARLPSNVAELVDLALDLSIIERTDLSTSDRHFYLPVGSWAGTGTSTWNEVRGLWYRKFLQVTVQKVRRAVNEALANKQRWEIDSSAIIALLDRHYFNGDDDLIDILTGMTVRQSLPQGYEPLTQIPGQVPTQAVPISVGLSEAGDFRWVNWVTGIWLSKIAAVVPTWTNSISILQKLNLSPNATIVEPVVSIARTAYLINKFFPNCNYYGGFLDLDYMARVEGELADNIGHFHAQHLDRLATDPTWLPDSLNGTVVFLPDLRDPLGVPNTGNSYVLEQRLYFALVKRMERNETFFMVAYWDSSIEKLMLEQVRKYPTRLKAIKDRGFFPFTIFEVLKQPEGAPTAAPPFAQLVEGAIERAILPLPIDLLNQQPDDSLRVERSEQPPELKDGDSN